MIKFYKVKNDGVLLVVDTKTYLVAAFRLDNLTPTELDNLTVWWGDSAVSDYIHTTSFELRGYIALGIEEIK